jgi:hypothetical protein
MTADQLDCILPMLATWRAASPALAPASSANAHCCSNAAKLCTFPTKQLAGALNSIMQQRSHLLQQDESSNISQHLEEMVSIAMMAVAVQ